MSVVTVQNQEDNHGRIGWENVDGVPFSRTATSAPMDPNPSLAEERPTKNRPDQCIGRNIAEAVKVS